MKLKDQKSWHKLKLFMNVLSAFVASKIIKNNSGKKIAMVGGNLGEKYEDNASVFHQYLIKNYADQVTAYWLYDPKTTYAKTEKIPNAIPLGSFKNYLLFFQADYTFHGHSIMYDIAPGADKFLFLNKKTIITHVSHGIEGFKKILIQKEDIPLLKRTDYFNCASSYEMRLKRDEWDIPEHKLIITGLPRFDRYPANQPPPRVKNVLMMMTWREWLLDLNDDEFLESDYFKSTVNILKHEGIKTLLQDENVHVKVALHPFMKRFEHHFHVIENDRVEFLDFKSMSFGDVIKDMDLLLTDITSISWDFFYLNKPIIFYLFDEQEFIAKRGLYLDLDKDLYGYRANTVDDVYRYLHEVTAGGVSYNKWYSWAPRYFDFFDQRNCARLAERVFGLL